jgi:mono/diheme cytochrome c family protein
VPILDLFTGAGRLATAAGVVHVVALLLAAGTALLAPVLVLVARRRSDRFLLDWVRRHESSLAIWPRLAALATGLLLALAFALTSPGIAAAVARTLELPLLTAAAAGLLSLAAGVAWARGERLGAGARRVAGWVGALAAAKALSALTAGLAFLAAPAAGLEPAGVAALLGAPLLFGALLAAWGAAIGLAGLLVVGTAAGEEAPFGGRTASHGAFLALGGLGGVAAGAWWLAGRLEPAQLDAVAGEVPSAELGLAIAAVSLAALAGLLALTAHGAGRWRLLRTRPWAMLLALLAVAGVAGGDAVVTGVRLPWAIGSGRQGALYANGLTPAEVERARAEGLRVGGGREIFQRACANCHLTGDYSLRPLLGGLPAASITPVLLRLHKLPGHMPPFPGSREDAAALANHLAASDGTGAGPLPPQPPELVAAGRRVLERRCLGCHRDVPLAPRVVGWSAGFAFEVLGRLPRLAAGMPAFPGDEAERRALAAYLSALGGGYAE